MRDYSKVSSQFWLGETGRKLRGNYEAQIVALYLMTSPHANMIGVFHCPINYIAHETGLPIEGASKGLASLIEARFCTYYEDSELVYVHEMAKFQIGDALKADDKRVIGVRREHANIPDSRARTAFAARYGSAFYLMDQGGKPKGLARASKAPSKPGAGAGTRTGEKTLAPSDDSLAAGAGDVVAKLPTTTGEEFEVRESQSAEWGTLFPAVDVPQELRNMQAWLLANPVNRKTPRGMMRFATSWLTKTQNRARRINGTHHPSVGDEPWKGAI